MTKPPQKGPEFSREREWKVILEELHSQFKVFGEGLAGLREDLTEFRLEVRNRFQQIENRLQQIEIELLSIKSPVLV